MGMYSFFENEEIEVHDWEGVKNAVLSVAEAVSSPSDAIYTGEYFPTLFKGMLNEENKTISFEKWNDIKLISYWYDEYLYFFEAIAPFISGKVVWTFENADEGGYVEFEDGEARVVTGKMNWVTWQPSENLRRDNKSLNRKMLKIFKLNKLRTGGKNVTSKTR